MKKFEKNRYGIAPQCPCGRSNRDGKFSPLNGYSNKGYCHSCDKYFAPEKDTPAKTSFKYSLPVPKQRYVSREVMQSTLKQYEKNIFFQWLMSLFRKEKTMELAYRFYIGTAKEGKTIFWQVNERNEIFNGRRFLYQDTGKRDPNTPPIPLFKKENGYHQCLFGLHQLKECPAEKIICLVEAEKTAVIGHAYYPGYTWMATGGANSFNNEKASPLAGRKILILNDCDETGRKGVLKWEETLIKYGCKVEICDLQPGITDGRDLADFLSQHAEETKRKEENTPLYKMIKKNPSLQTLIRTFDLLQ